MTRDFRKLRISFDALANRLRILYMSGNATDLEIIFGAKDFSDLIDKMELVKSLANSDKELISEIQTKLDELSTKKESLEADKKDLETQQASLKSDQDEFNKLISDNDEILKKSLRIKFRGAEFLGKCGFAE